VEKHRVTHALAAAIEAGAVYVTEALHAAAGCTVTGASLPDLRRAACMAIDAAEASVHRMLIEPRAEAAPAGHDGPVEPGARGRGDGMELTHGSRVLDARRHRPAAAAVCQNGMGCEPLFLPCATYACFLSSEQPN
jgi:hypothetical protein